MIGALVRRTTAQSIATATWTTIEFDAEVRDDGGLHDTGSNTGRLTAPVDGWYHVTGAAEFASNGSGGRWLRLRLNGTTIVRRINKLSNAGGNPDGHDISLSRYLAAGDYIELQAFQDSGGNLDVTTEDPFAPNFSMVLVTAANSKKITELAAISALDEDDILAVVEDGTTKKVTLAQLRTALFAGVKASASSITVSSGGFPGSVIAFASEDWDTHSFHDTATNNSRFTVPSGMGGKYQIGGAIYWGSSSSGGGRALYWRKNGTVQTFGVRSSFAENDAISNFVTEADLAAGDYVELNPYQETGGDLTSCSVEFWIEKRS